MIVHQQICRLQVPMNYFALMQILHSLADINCELQQLREFQDVMILMQVIIQTSSRHILCKQDKRQKTNKKISTQIFIKQIPIVKAKSQIPKVENMKVDTNSKYKSKYMQKKCGYIFCRTRQKEQRELLQVIEGGDMKKS